MSKLIGKKLFLAPMDVADAPKYVEWLNDFETSIYLYAYQQVITLENEASWLRDITGRGEPQFGIRLQEDGRLIGNCGLINVNQLAGKAEAGIFIGDKSCRGQGLGEEALQLLLDYGFNVLNLHSIMIKVFSFNERALKCYKKCGFREAGRLREAALLGGERHDEIILDMLASEYKSYILKELFVAQMNAMQR